MSTKTKTAKVNNRKSTNRINKLTEMTEYCRLCADLKSPDEIVITIDNVEHWMEQKLRVCCEWTDENREHQLPHGVCAICLDKLEKCWLFAQSVQLAQQRLLQIFAHAENEAETEMVEIVEMKPLPTKVEEVGQIGDDPPILLPHPNDFNPAPSLGEREKTPVDHLLESNETEIMPTLPRDDVFECLLCHQKYNHLDSLRKHNKRRLKNKCEVCSRVFCAALKFQEHKRVDRCGLSAFDDQNNSMEIESNELTADQSNEDKRKTVNEEKTRQMDNNPHKCLVCDKTFKRRWYLTEHMRTHSDARDFECVHCHQKFKTTENLRKHSNRRSKNKCEFCLRVFCGATELYAHKHIEGCESSTLNDQNNSNQAPRRSPSHAVPESLRTHKKSAKFYKCHICGRAFTENYNLRNHYRTHSAERPFECWLCHRTMKMIGALRKHMKMHTICLEVRKSIVDARKRAKFKELYGDGEPIDFEKLKLECQKCGKRFMRVSTLKEHCAKHLIDKPFECTLCHKTFKLMKPLKTHMNVHTRPPKHMPPVTDLNWICEHCGISYKRKRSLIEHMQSAHSDGTTYECSVCNAGFKTERGVKEHHRITHTNHRYKCKRCDAAFKYKNQLYFHTMRHDGPLPKKHLCDLCGKGFAWKKSIEVHRRTHTGEKPFKCEHCGSHFRTKGSWRTHIKDVHGIATYENRQSQGEPITLSKPQLAFKCETCGLGYKSKTLLISHLRSHTEMQHECTQCDKKFRKRHSLKLHMEMHSGVINKSHVCDFCGKRFRKQCDLTEHRRIHTGEKPFSCDHCTSHFRTMSSFYSHLKKAHGISVSARNKEERLRATKLLADATANQMPQSSSN